MTPRLFADDTCLVFNASTINNLTDKINLDLANICSWMKSNKLYINPQKSTALIISPKSYNDFGPQNLTIPYDNSAITISKSAKYLGVQIDDDLLFKFPIQSLHTKLSRSLRILFKVKHYLPSSAQLNCLVPYFILICYIASQFGHLLPKQISIQLGAYKTNQLLVLENSNIIPKLIVY